MISEEVRGWISRPQQFTTAEGVSVVRTVIDGIPIFFTVADSSDRIQRKHSRGKFYEPDELELIRAEFPPGGVFCDIGANVGNHSIFALKFLAAREAILFEPNPLAYRLLVSNLILNGLIGQARCDYLGVGIGAEDGGGFGIIDRDGNLGAARLEQGSGDIQVRNADRLLEGQQIDFVKIDVEGMEVEVFAGLEETIRRCRPPVFVEVEHVNRQAVDGFLKRVGYEVAVEGRRFRHNQNLLLKSAA